MRYMIQVVVLVAYSCFVSTVSSTVAVEVREELTASK